MMEKPQLFIVKIGGAVIDDEAALQQFTQGFATIPAAKILVHGGGRMATTVAEGMGIQQQLVGGRRITDAETLKVVTMVYAGWINKQVVALLQAKGCHAVGLSGADGNVILANKRQADGINYGFAGDVLAVNVQLLTQLIDQNATPVLCPITHDGAGQLLNTNADTIASEVAKTLAKNYRVRLLYCFEQNGVLSNRHNPDSVIREITPQAFVALKAGGVVSDGMLPKLENAFAAVDSGVERVVIGAAQNLAAMVNGNSGTAIING